jgi:uncharacterized protein (TIGR00297 family)
MERHARPGIGRNDDMIFIGLLISLYIAYGAFQRQALTAGGAVWAVIIGTTLFGLGGGVPGLALIAFFLSSTALSRHRQAEKDQRTADLVEKGGQRDAYQVLANGGPAALFALLYGLTDYPAFYVGALASLAAATADTWATEIGLLSPTPPRHILSWREVPPGTSGAVSTSGLWGTLAGAVFIAFLTFLEPTEGALFRALLVAFGGLIGGTGDSILGALLQEQRQCLSCGKYTEQKRHACGGETLVVAGLPGCDNDVVNALATTWGGAAAAAVWALLAGR